MAIFLWESKEALPDFYQEIITAEKFYERREAMFRKSRQKYREVQNKNYKSADELTGHDLELINMDRDNTGIYTHSDEYYYNHLLNYNFNIVKE